MCPTPLESPVDKSYVSIQASADTGQGDSWFVHRFLKLLSVVVPTVCAHVSLAKMSHAPVFTQRLRLAPSYCVCRGGEIDS